MATVSFCLLQSPCLTQWTHEQCVIMAQMELMQVQRALSPWTKADLAVVVSDVNFEVSKINFEL